MLIIIKQPDKGFIGYTSISIAWDFYGKASCASCVFVALWLERKEPSSSSGVPGGDTCFSHQ